MIRNMNIRKARIEQTGIEITFRDGKRLFITDTELDCLRNVGEEVGNGLVFLQGEHGKKVWDFLNHEAMEARFGPIPHSYVVQDGRLGT